MKLLATLALSAGLLAITATMASASPSFNCRYASLATEKAICGNSYLQQLDRQMAGLYRFAQSHLYGYSAKKLRNSQRGFLRSRNSCGWNIGCIEANYNDRNTFLETFGD